MKIACITPDDLSTIIFCKTLIKINYQISSNEIYTISPVDLYRNELYNLNPKHIEIQMFRWISIFKDLKYLIQLYSIIKKNNFDYVITFTTKPNIYGAIAAYFAGVKNITIAVRGLGQIFNKQDSLKDIILRFFLKYLYKISISCAKFVWFTNKYDQKLFIDEKIVKKNKTILSKNALDLDYFSMNSLDLKNLEELKSQLNVNSGDRVVIMVARLIWSKGINEFVSAAISLFNELPRTHFFLVAPEEKNSPEAVPTSFILAAEKKSNLKWLGFRKDVRELYAISNLSVLPSYYREGGYPRALIEAMALGKAVIAADTDHCKNPVDEGKNGYLVPIKNSIALANKIKSILQDNSKLRKFGDYSRQKAINEFDDRKVINEVLRKINIY